MDLVDRIRSFSVFAEAPEDFLIAVGSCLRMQVHAAQEAIINEGEEARAMYWLIRGSVVVTSRDRESVYAELPSGALFGEIGILMNVPRTATVLARSKSLVARLNKEDLTRLLPRYPDVERTLREEAAERLAILRRKKNQPEPAEDAAEQKARRPSKRDFSSMGAESEPSIDDGQPRRNSNKRIKSPSPPTVSQPGISSALATGTVNVRQLLRKLPLFSGLPDPFLHFLGLNAEPINYPPFTTIIKENTTGRDVFFITEGTVEVFNEAQDASGAAKAEEHQRNVRARLTEGQFFGEVTSLWLAPERTASVRTVNAVECLKVSGSVIDELWRRCPKDVKQKVEDVARQRVQDNVRLQIRVKSASPPDEDEDIEMPEAVEPGVADEQASAGAQATMAFREISFSGSNAAPSSPEPFDPDPFSSADRPPRRPGLSRRGSAANIPIEPSPLARDAAERRGSIMEAAESANQPRRVALAQPRPSTSHRSSGDGKGPLPDNILEMIFQHLHLYDLMLLRQVCVHWQRLITRSPNILHTLDLSKYNRYLNDTKIITVIAPFVASRPRSIDLSNCFHVTDEGFSALIATCGSNVTHWRMKSVWEISPASIMQMTVRSPNLISLDFSNCRKVSDSLLTRVVGWVQRAPRPAPAQAQAGADPEQEEQQTYSMSLMPPPPQPTAPPPVGCPHLRRLTLSYCKHVTDRFMTHLAHHASSRLEEMDLTRCTTISDAGFRAWAERPFPRLRKLVLADCTYLSDTAIACLVKSARGLEDLDLSFCCALSDASVERCAVGLPRLRKLDLAFCGSAVSDGSMAGIGKGLRRLRHLSVRGCVRVTAAGVEAVLVGCPEMRLFDVSQCRNLSLEERWIGGQVVFRTVADGKWRVGR